MNPTWLAALFLTTTPAMARAPDAAEQAYQAARTGYYALKADAKRRRLRDSWLSVARRFEAVARSYPGSPRAPDALFTAAQMLADLSRISLVPEDLTASMEDYRGVVDSYPRHRLADDAALALAHAYLDRLNQPEAARKVLRRGLQLPRGDQTARMQSLLASLPAETREGPASASPRRRERQPEPSRTASSRPDGRPPGRAGALEVAERAMRAGPSSAAHPAQPEAVPEVPASLEQPAEEAPDAEEVAPEERWAGDLRDGGRHRGKRVAGMTAPSDSDVPRVKGIPDAGPLLAQAPAEKVRERLRALGKRQTSEVTLAEQLGLKVRRVVIDPGHGGHDTGTIGAGGAKEKDVALGIARRLGAILREQGLEVVQTRERDRFVRLEDRTRMANTARGDLFISIHCNSVPQKWLRGVETYSLNLSSDRYAIRLAARENSTSEKGLSDLQFLLADLATRANTEESTRLATRVQNSLVSHLVSRQERSHDLGTKEALFYVLLGTKMPAVLVETGFLSNPEEERRLASSQGQEAVARAIAAGVQDFLGNRDRVAKVD